MGAAAASFEVRTDSAATVVSAVQRTMAQVDRPAGAFVFCSGRLATAIPEIAHGLSTSPDVPVSLASGLGVLSERGELDEVSAATGLVWSGPRAELTMVDDDAELTTEHLEALLPTGEQRLATVLLIRSEGFDPEALWGLRRSRPHPLVFGAGIHGRPGLACVDRSQVRYPAALSIRLPGLAQPTVRTAHSCRLLSEPLPVTAAEGAMVREIGGEPALTVLERLGAELRGQPLVFTVLARPTEQDDYQLLVRGIQGIDPDSRSLLISQEVQSDLLMTFAVRDPAAAREDMARVCRQSARELKGAVPRFALYFNCSGRGQNLYGTPNADTRVLKEHFGTIPFAGIQSAFEIGPFDGAPALQLYTGVLAVFGAPS